MKQLFITVLLLLSSLCGHSRTPLLEQQAPAGAAEAWVDSVYNSLTTRQKVAQLVFPKAVPTQGANSKAVLKRYVEQNGVGGLLFTAGTLEQYVEMTNYAQSVAKVPLLMTFDGEWGLAMRISDTPHFPCNMALGAISDLSLLEDYGREVGRECRLAGIQVDFAPVIDVNSNPKNPVIGYRSFGEDPERVAALGTAFALGMEKEGVQAVGKHFPGHGDTSTDSHRESTVVTHSRQVLEDVDLKPFKSFIDNGISGIMIGHIAVPAIDPSGRPASLSKKLTQELLREQMGFEGLIYTDALGMRGATDAGLNTALAALQAGADVLLSSKTPMEDIDILVQALRDGKISMSTIEDRCRRILKYKYLLGLNNWKPLEIKGLSAQINSPQAEVIIDRLAKGSMTLLRNKGDVLPLGDLAHSRIAIVNVCGTADNDFAEICSRYTNVDVYASEAQPFSEKTLSEIRNHDVVVAAVYSDSPEARRMFGQLAQMPRLTAVFFTSPYKMDKFHSALGDASAILIAYENKAPMRAAAAMALFGGIDVNGKLPVNLPRIAPLGSGISLKKCRLGYSPLKAKGFRACLADSVDRLIDNCLKTGAFPGCQIVVARGGDIVMEKSYGLLTAGGDPVTNATLYDLASVSKATGTLPGVMKAYDLGLFDLDAPAAEYIPGLKEAGKTFTPRELLFHETGMPASLNVYQLMMDTTTYTGKLFTPKQSRGHNIYLMKNAWGNDTARLRRDITSTEQTAATPHQAAAGIWVGEAAFDTIMGRIYNSELRPTKKYNYSCLNFCLLMDMEQRVTGQSHDRWVCDSIFRPLGAHTMGYRAAETHPGAAVAPTETDTFMRRQALKGFVHDETAAMIGGVSGNAGLFASAGDIAKLCQMWLNGGTYGDARILSPQTVELFTTTKSPTCRRGLGFDKPDVENPDNSPTCEEAGPAVYGHLGFTGTVFWVDPDKDLIFIFLNNRVNPTRDNPAFSRANIRPELFRQIYLAIDE